MKVFLAGIIQGSLSEPVIHDQDWREPIRRAIARHLPGAEVYCHFSEHPNSITYGQEDIRRTFDDGVRRAAACDLLVAYLPEASMGTAIEMHEASRAGAVVVTVGPLAANWVVRRYSDRIVPDVASLEELLASGQIERLVRERRGGPDQVPRGAEAGP